MQKSAYHFQWTVRLDSCDWRRSRIVNSMYYSLMWSVEGHCWRLLGLRAPSARGRQRVVRRGVKSVSLDFVPFLLSLYSLISIFTTRRSKRLLIPTTVSQPFTSTCVHTYMYTFFIPHFPRGVEGGGLTLGLILISFAGHFCTLRVTCT